MQRGISPEEKLLKLIRRKSPRSLKKAGAVRQNQIVGDVIQNIIEQSKGGNNLFKLLNSFFIFISGISLIFIIYNFFYERKNPDVFLNGKTSNFKEAISNDMALVPQKVFSYYEEQIQERDLFQPVEHNVDSPEITNTKGDASAKIASFKKKFRLVGVILDAVPEAVVEELPTHKTRFLCKGDRLKEAIVEEILEGKIILSYQGEKVELLQ